MPKQRVTEYLLRAREAAALADNASGEEKRRLLQVSAAWLKLTEDAAVEALQSAGITAIPFHATDVSRSH